MGFFFFFFFVLSQFCDIRKYLTFLSNFYFYFIWIYKRKTKKIQKNLNKTKTTELLLQIPIIIKYMCIL